MKLIIIHRVISFSKKLKWKEIGDSKESSQHGHSLYGMGKTLSSPLFSAVRTPMLLTLKFYAVKMFCTLNGKGSALEALWVWGRSAKSQGQR